MNATPKQIDFGIVLGRGEWAISGLALREEKTGNKTHGLVFQHLKKAKKIGTAIKGKDPYNSPPFYLAFCETSDIDRFIETLQMLKMAIDEERSANNEQARNPESLDTGGTGPSK